jgi:hypothetical protein
VTTFPTGLTGAAGEYYVAAELSRRGWLATVTVKNAPGTDVLAQDLTTKRTLAIQTKTSANGKSFTLGPKDTITVANDAGWFVLVGFRALDERPSFYIVPRAHLAAMLYAGHRRWVDTPGRNGQPHTDSTRLVILRDSVEGYLERWDFLDAPVAKVPYMGDEWHLEALQKQRWRPEHVPPAIRRRLKR